MDGYKKALLEARELGRDFPLLEQALDHEETLEATDARIYWRKPPMESFGSNFVEIQRHPWSISRTGRQMGGHRAEERMRDRKLIEALQRIEITLEHGVPRRIATLRMDIDEETGEWKIREDVVQTCGGFRHFLGRDLLPTDHFELRPMGDFTVLEHRQPPGADRYDYEFHAEFSLEVNP